MVLFKINFIIFALGSRLDSRAYFVSSFPPPFHFFESVLISVSVVITLNASVSRTLYHKLVTVMLWSTRWIDDIRTVLILDGLWEYANGTLEKKGKMISISFFNLSVLWILWPWRSVTKAQEIGRSCTR